MAIFKPYKGKESSLQNLPIEDGQIIFTTDTKKIYVDEAGVRICYIQEDAMKTYVQNDEPQDAKNGDIWIITEEE